MAPINNPSGTEVSEIVLPNGNTASEVIAPDGSTVFSATPDSVVLLPESDDDTHFSGDTGSITIDSTSPVFDHPNNNDLSFKVAATSPTIYSTSGLPNYPTTDVEFLLRFYVGSGIGARVYYSSGGAVLSNSQYGITIRDDGTDPEFGFIRRDSDGSLGTQNTTTVSFSTPQWATITGTHQGSGDYSLSLYTDYSQSADATVTGSDSTHITSGSFDNSGTAYREFNSVQGVIDQFIADSSEIN